MYRGTSLIRNRPSIGYDALAFSVRAVLAVVAGSGSHGGGGGRSAPRPGKFHERRKGDQLLELWNEAGDEAGCQGMMLMGHGEDDAGTSEAVIDSGDGGGTYIHVL